MLRKLRVDQGAVAEQHEFRVGMSLKRNGGAGNDDRCADIATHGVKRNSNLLRHERPGNLISCGLEAGPAEFHFAAAAVIGEASRSGPLRQ